MTALELWGQARPYAAAMGLVALLAALESLVALLLPWSAMRFTDAVFTGGAFVLPLRLVLLLGILFLLQMVLRILSAWFSGRLALRIAADTRVRLHAHLQSLPLAYVRKQGSGDLLALLTRECEALAQFIGFGLFGLPMACLTALAALVLLYVLEPWFASLLLLLLPLCILLLSGPARRLRHLATGVQASYARLLQRADEHLALLPLIKSCVRENWSNTRFREQVGRFREASELQLQANALLQPLLQFVLALAVLGIATLAARHLVSGGMTPGELVGVILYAVVLVRPLGSVGLLYSQWETAAGALARLQRVLATPQEYQCTGKTPVSCRGDLRVESLWYSHDGRKPLLQGLELWVPAGGIVALVGQNGAGKTTLLHLLLRFLQPDAGRILLDGEDIAGLDLRFLRRNLAWVDQQHLFLDASVRENLLLGHEAASGEAMDRVLDAVGLRDFIRDLPQGMDTVIGEQGARLSGGQRQRLALARALLQPARVLLLDEATAMLDPEGERAVIAAIRPLLAGRTVLFITHRPASLALADRVLELRDGRVYETSGGYRHAGGQVAGF